MSDRSPRYDQVEIALDASGSRTDGFRFSAFFQAVQPAAMTRIKAARPSGI